ncbi:hypothetical protein BDR07DRAFT_1377621 [Suillus spraguei]|nr:hypothetical protein BDR07DRAFT_1377621 [Suillus spraguei]
MVNARAKVTANLDITTTILESLIIFDLRNEYVVCNLNLVIPYGAFNILDKSLQDVLGFTIVSKVAHPAMAPYIGRFRIYIKDNHIITVTESKTWKVVGHAIVVMLNICHRKYAHVIRPFLVPVPVCDGIASAPTLDNVDVNHWVKQNHNEQTPFTGCIVSQVSPWNLKCGTSGNYLKRGKLEKAKYQLHVIHPTDKVLGRDFDAAITNLDHMQKIVGTTGDHQNMVIRDVTGEMLHVVANVFEPRKTPIPDSPRGQ